MNRARRLPFTLPELTAALGILMFLMYILFSFFSGAQRIWQQGRANSEIYERANLFFDIVEQDLKAMTVSDQQGARINYWTADMGATTLDPANGWLIAFVSSSGLGATDTDVSNLIEVAYRYDSSSNTVERFMTRSVDGAAYDFYTNWNNHGWSGTFYSDSSILAEGVDAIAFQAYAGGGVADSTADSTVAVDSAVVSISLFDPRAGGTADVNIQRTLRTFKKTLYFNR